MAITKIYFNDSLPHGRLLRTALSNLEDGHDALNDVIACMELMVDGDGSQVTHFDEMTTRFAFPTTTVAKAAYEELQSLKSKLNTNASVTDVLNALNQAFAKFR